MKYKDPTFLEEYNRVIDNSLIPHAEDKVSIPNTEHIGMKLGLPQGDDGALRHTTDKRRKLDVEGNLLGKSSKYTLLDS